MRFKLKMIDSVQHPFEDILGGIRDSTLFYADKEGSEVTARFYFTKKGSEEKIDIFEEGLGAHDCNLWYEIEASFLPEDFLAYLKGKGDSCPE